MYFMKVLLCSIANLKKANDFKADRKKKHLSKIFRPFLKILGCLLKFLGCFSNKIRHFSIYILIFFIKVLIFFEDILNEFTETVAYSSLQGVIALYGAEIQGFIRLLRPFRRMYIHMLPRRGLRRRCVTYRKRHKDSRLPILARLCCVKGHRHSSGSHK